jgi:hypothetical protein
MKKTRSASPAAKRAATISLSRRCVRKSSKELSEEKI